MSRFWYGLRRGAARRIIIDEESQWQRAIKPTRRAFVDPDDRAGPFDQGVAEEVRTLSPSSWAGRSRTYPKVSTTLRLDAEVLEHFRKGGPGWQTRINAVLQSAVKRGKRAA